MRTNEELLVEEIYQWIMSNEDMGIGEYYVVKETTAHREYIGGFYLSTN